MIISKTVTFDILISNYKSASRSMKDNQLPKPFIG